MFEKSRLVYKKFSLIYFEHCEEILPLQLFLCRKLGLKSSIMESQSTLSCTAVVMKF